MFREPCFVFLPYVLTLPERTVAPVDILWLVEDCAAWVNHFLSDWKDCSASYVEDLIDDMLDFYDASSVIDAVRSELWL